MLAAGASQPIFTGSTSGHNSSSSCIIGLQLEITYEKGLVFFSLFLRLFDLQHRCHHLGAINPCHGHQPPAYSGVRRMLDSGQILKTGQSLPEPRSGRGYSLRLSILCVRRHTLLLPIDLANAD